MSHFDTYLQKCNIDTAHHPLDKILSGWGSLAIAILFRLRGPRLLHSGMSLVINRPVIAFCLSVPKAISSICLNSTWHSLGITDAPGLIVPGISSAIKTAYRYTCPRTMENFEETVSNNPRLGNLQVWFNKIMKFA